MQASFVDKLEGLGLESKYVDLVGKIQRYAGEAQRTSDLFGTKNLAAGFSKLARGLKGVENVYTQHSPLLKGTLETLFKSKFVLEFTCCRGEVRKWCAARNPLR